MANLLPALLLTALFCPAAPRSAVPVTESALCKAAPHCVCGQTENRLTVLKCTNLASLSPHLRLAGAMSMCAGPRLFYAAMRGFLRRVWCLDGSVPANLFKNIACEDVEVSVFFNIFYAINRVAPQNLMGSNRGFEFLDGAHFLEPPIWTRHLPQPPHPRLQALRGYKIPMRWAPFSGYFHRLRNVCVYR